MRNMFALPGETPSAKRYMESPDYVELHGLSANAVATKAAFLEHRCKRNLLFFLQAMSLRPGGLHEFAKNLLAELPETGEHSGGKHESEYHNFTLRLLDGAMDHGGLPTFLVALCVNPKLCIELPGIDTNGTAARYVEHVMQRYPSLNDNDCQPVEQYYKGLVPALFHYMEQHAERVKRSFVMTEVAERVFATLDTALDNPDRIAMLEGREGVGKSECAKTWCEQHLGVARYISLSGITNRTAFMGTLARALGIPTRAYAAAQLQTRIEDVLQQAKLMLVIDEAHYLFGASDRFRTQPELLNWVYTACSNFGVPVALLTTAMFGAKMRQAERQVVWNAGQFERRVRPYVKLPDAPRVEDLQAVALKLMPDASKPTLNLAVGYAGATRFPYTNLADAIKEARRIANKAGRAEPTLADMKSAVLDYRGPSDKAAAEAFRAPVHPRQRAARKPYAEPLQDGLTAISDPVKRGDRDDFADVESAENPRFRTPISGRAGGDLVTG